MVESDTSRVSVLPVESDTARVSALPVVGSEVPVAYVGKVALDSVGLRVGPSCLQLDPEETLPALLDERSVMSCVDLGVTPDGGPMEGAPVLEPLEHSVPEKTLDGRPMDGIAVLEPLEHSVLEIALDVGLIMDLSVFEPFEHSVLEEALDVRPKRVRSGLGQLEYSVPDVAPFWGECLFIRMTVSDPLEHSGLGATDSTDLDGGHMEVMSDFHPLEHSVLITALDGRPMAGITVLEQLEHSVLDVDMDSLWMAPWDAGGTLRIGSRPEMAIRRDILCCVVRLSRRPVFPAAGYLGYFGGLARTCVIDLYTGVSTTPVEMLVDDNQTDFPRLQFPPVGVEVWLSTSVTLASGYSPDDSPMTDLGFLRASCTPVEMCAVELNFPRARFPPGEICAERRNYIRLASLTGSPVCTRTVTRSLLLGSPHRLVRGSSCSALLFPRRFDDFEDIPVNGRGTSVRQQDIHASFLVTLHSRFSSDIITSVLIITTHGFLFERNRLVLCQYEQCLIPPGILAWIVLFYCLVVARFLSSGESSAMEQDGPSSASSAPLAGTFLCLSLDLASDQLYDLAPKIPDIMGLRALRASAAIVKVMSVPDSRCIRVVVPDDHVNIGFHEVLLHDMEEEDLPFMALSEVNCLRHGWLRCFHVQVPA